MRWQEATCGLNASGICIVCFFVCLKTVGQFVDEIAEAFTINGGLEGLADDALCGGLVHEETMV